MTQFANARTDSTPKLAAVLKLDHEDILEAIAEVFPELPEGSMLTRCESLRVVQAVCPERYTAALLELRQ